MSNDLNRCEFIGRIGTIDIRYTPDSKAVCNISLAVNEDWKNKQGKKQERVTWVPIVIFGKLAEVAKDYLEKGKQIYACGKFMTRKWQDDKGQDRYSTEVVIDGFNGTGFQMLGSKSDGSNKATQQAQEYERSYQSQSGQRDTQQYDDRNPPPGDYQNGEFDDDIPV